MAFSIYNVNKPPSFPTPFRHRCIAAGGTL